ncbi:MAG: hypothetical protein JXA82_01930 [Sedimentisphaerales bacterium]|nr:hypothetical protein [Sedimentisphaerales bacterium]
MGHCPRIADCAFLKEEIYRNMPRLLQRFQNTYCQNRFTDCACYKIASVLGDQFVPSLMLPSQIEWAQQILKDNTPALTTP